MLQQTKTIKSTVKNLQLSPNKRTFVIIKTQKDKQI